MFKAEVMGNLGADAQLKTTDGSKFITFRVADSRSWKNAKGEKESSTEWIDVTLPKEREDLLPFLKKGTKVLVRGNATRRVYSSKKDKCLKAGITIHAFELDFCGGVREDVPRELIDEKSGQIYKVTKYYCCDFDTSRFNKDDTITLVDSSMNPYLVTKGGWVSPIKVADNSRTNSQFDETQQS